MVQQKPAPHRVKPSFDVYDGDDKYVFITYAHKDAKSVFSDLEQFNDLGINIFYDDGLPVGSAWFESIETKISKSKMFVPFLSPNTVNSRVSRDEIFLAYLFNLPILPIYLKETKLEKGLNLAIGSLQSIYKYELSDENYSRICNREFERFGLININTEKNATPKKENNKKFKLSTWFRDFLTGNQKASSARGRMPEPIPYIYISYSNKDISSVIPEIERYIQEGYEVKFDKGLNFNDKNDLPKFMDLIVNCGIFVVFLSENAIDSNQVKMELKIANVHNKPIIPIYLEETELSPEFESILKSSQPLYKYENQYDEEYVEAFDNILKK